MLVTARMGLWIIIKTLQKMVRMAMLALLFRVLAGLEAPPGEHARPQSRQHKGCARSLGCNQTELGGKHAVETEGHIWQTDTVWTVGSQLRRSRPSSCPFTRCDPSAATASCRSDWKATV